MFLEKYVVWALKKGLLIIAAMMQLRDCILLMFIRRNEWGNSIWFI